MARVVRFHQLGGPEVLKIETVDVPPPGQGEVRIAVKALGLNRAESMFRRGQYLEDPVFPARLGYEAAGTIESVGPGVEGFQPGDAVSTIPAFSQQKYGVYGNLVVVPATAVAKHPPNMSWVDAAAIWMQYLTAYGAMIDVGRLSAGETVLIPAASSSVGLAAIQIANLVGATPIALTRTDEKRAALTRLGAAPRHRHPNARPGGRNDAIDRRQGSATRVRPRRRTDGCPPGRGHGPGRAVVGIRQSQLQPTPLPLMELLGKLLTIRGFVLFEVTRNPTRKARGVEFVLAGLAADKLRPVIAKKFPFSEIVEATRYLESNQQIGKIVVTL